MAYNAELETSIDKLIDGWDMALNKKNMFGGIGYMINGNMAFGIHKDELIVRANEQQGKTLLKAEGIRIFDMTGRPMKNWFMASGKAIEPDKNLGKLLKIGRDFALSLPPK